MIDRLTLPALARCGLLTALLLVAPVVVAAPPTDDDATSQRIAELYQRANVLYGKKSLAEAEALYREAWKLKKTYDVACNFGAIELDLGRPREAAEYLTFALQEFPAGEKPAAREQIKARLTLARSQVGAVRVRVNVAGAQVSVGDRVIGNAPIEDEVFVDPGLVTVSASAPGYEQTLSRVSVAKGGSADVELSLVQARPRWPMVVTGVLAAGGLAAGAGLAVAANAKGGDAAAVRATLGGGRSQCVGLTGGSCTTLAGDLRSQGAFADGAVGGFVVGGVFALATAGLGIWAFGKPRMPTQGQLRIVPTVGAVEQGVRLEGSW
jgi:PEGA domain